jgi:hypothetical protein
MLNVNSNGKGASYRISDCSYSAAPQETGVKMVIPDMPPDMIAGILASWVCYQLLWMSWYSYFTRSNIVVKTFWKMIGLFDLVSLGVTRCLLQDSEWKMKGEST